MKHAQAILKWAAYVLFDPNISVILYYLFWYGVNDVIGKTDLMLLPLEASGLWLKQKVNIKTMAYKHICLFLDLILHLVSWTCDFKHHNSSRNVLSVNSLWLH